AGTGAGERFTGKIAVGLEVSQGAGIKRCRSGEDSHTGNGDDLSRCTVPQGHKNYGPSSCHTALRVRVRGNGRDTGAGHGPLGVATAHWGQGGPSGPKPTDDLDYDCGDKEATTQDTLHSCDEGVAALPAAKERSWHAGGAGATGGIGHSEAAEAEGEPARAVGSSEAASRGAPPEAEGEPARAGGSSETASRGAPAEAEGEPARAGGSSETASRGAPAEAEGEPARAGGS
ncbi:unnamed protein product, partial [Discosporangium mesarthrocarpum]